MIKAGILVFENVEVLDFAGPFEALSVAAGQSAGRLVVETVGLGPEVVCRGGLAVRPARLVSEDPTYDLLVVPGGPGARNMVAAARAVAPAGTAGATGPAIARSDPPTGEAASRLAEEGRTLIRYVAAHAERGAIVASVCTGAYFLAEAGLLAGRKATTHHGAFKHFGETYPGIELLTNRYVDEGPVVTSGGVSCGIDMALHLVGRLVGPEAARTVAETLEWPKPESGD